MHVTALSGIIPCPVAPERSAETKVGGGGQALFVVNGLPHQSFVCSECSGATAHVRIYPVFPSLMRGCMTFTCIIMVTSMGTETVFPFTPQQKGY